MMRALAFLTCILSLGIGALAETTQPNAKAPRVLVLPFATHGGDYEWYGKGVQQDLVVDLTRGARADVVTPTQSMPAENAEQAIAIGKSAGANYVVFGQTQSASKQIRLTGQMVDVATGKTVGALKATGKSEDLFKLEDIVAAQALAAMPPEMLTDDAVARQLHEQPGQSYASDDMLVPRQLVGGRSYGHPEYGAYVPQQSPVYVNNETTYIQTPATYGDSYPYGFYDYASPFFGGGFIVASRGFGRNFGHFNNFNHGGFHGNFNNNFHGGFHGGFNRGGFNGGFPRMVGGTGPIMRGR